MKDSAEIKLMRKRIFRKALVKFTLGFLFISLLIFVPAGTLHFLNGWIFIAGLLVPMTFALVYLINKDPELLEKRLNMKEKEEEQKKYVKFSVLLYVVSYLIPGFDFRFGWSDVPLWLVLVSYYTLIAMSVLPFLLGFRIINEEKVLLKGLPGYDKYREKVKYRMIPFVW
jgi:protein-S-isoprenylcysteine O-methyltransferase Ste14